MRSDTISAVFGKESVLHQTDKDQITENQPADCRLAVNNNFATQLALVSNSELSAVTTSKEVQKEIEAALAEDGAGHHQIEVMGLDPEKDFTGEVDGLGNPIFNGSIIAMYSGCGGYWQVYLSENRKWMMHSLDDYKEYPDVPLKLNLIGSEVVESIAAHTDRLLKT
jgi:hypothetical protein